MSAEYTQQPQAGPKTCVVCKEPIAVWNKYLELFRTVWAHGGRPIEYVHVSCAIKALETWVTKKEAKT